MPNTLPETKVRGLLGWQMARHGDSNTIARSQLGAFPSTCKEKQIFHRWNPQGRGYFAVSLFFRGGAFLLVGEQEHLQSAARYLVGVMIDN